MTHDELLAKIGNPIDEGYEYGDIVFNKALRAVVELHEPYGDMMCVVCAGIDYPCSTIKAIQKELNNG